MQQKFITKWVRMQRLLQIAGVQCGIFYGISTKKKLEHYEHHSCHLPRREVNGICCFLHSLEQSAKRNSFFSTK